jgi:hypothetical protein
VTDPIAPHESYLDPRLTSQVPQPFVSQKSADFGLGVRKSAEPHTYLIPSSHLFLHLVD